MKRRSQFIQALCLLTFVMVTLLATTADAQVRRRRPKRPARPPQKEDFLFKPMYAQFLDSETVLKGDHTGLKVIRIENGEVMQTALTEGHVISTMMAGPVPGSGVIVAAESGDVYLVEWKDAKLQVNKIMGLEKLPLTIVKTAMFHPFDASRILLADDRGLVMGKLASGSLTDQTFIKMNDDYASIGFVVRDHIDPECFIIDSVQNNRYRGCWQNDTIEDIHDGTLPHGCKTTGKEFTFIPFGDNAQYLRTFFIPGIAVYMKHHPKNPQTYFAAAMGKSPLLISIDKSNYYTVTSVKFNQKITYCVDIDPAKPDNMLITSKDSILISKDAGNSWKAISEVKTQ